eukprot:5716261-Amphidinium_carterae.2
MEKTIVLGNLADMLKHGEVYSMSLEYVAANEDWVFLGKHMSRKLHWTCSALGTTFCSIHPCTVMNSAAWSFQAMVGGHLLLLQQAHKNCIEGSNTITHLQANERGLVTTLVEVLSFQQTLPTR